MIWVGLTGGVASGKSTLSQFFREAGAYIIDADEIAHEVIRKTGLAYQPIVEIFGEKILDVSGEVDRKRLGEIVFADAGKRARLNLLVHPHVFDIAEARKREMLSRNKDAVIIFDAALLIETGVYREMDWVLLAYVDKETQVARLIKRDGLSKEEAERRIDIQMPLDEKAHLVDEIIDNRASPAVVEIKVKEIYQRLQEKARVAR